jgi:hypothetical protein
MPSDPPIGNKPPSPPPPEPNKPAPDTQPAPPPVSGGGGGGMSAFLDMFTPEEKKKFMNILVQNLTRAIQKESKKIVEELKKERQRIQGGGDDS